MNAPNKYPSLWTFPQEEKPLESTENVPVIMNQQTQYLREEMNGKVSASFQKAAFNWDQFKKKAKQIQEQSALGRLRSASEHDKKRDAGPLYSRDRYTFDIYNDVYDFRLMEVELPPFYPVNLFVDPDVISEAQKIADELYTKTRIDENQEKYLCVSSDEELLDTLRVLLSTRKVQFMLYKLRQQSEEVKKGA